MAAISAIKKRKEQAPMQDHRQASHKQEEGHDLGALVVVGGFFRESQAT